MANEILKVANGVRLQVHVIPKSSRNRLGTGSNGDIKLWLNAPPVDGKANEACIKFLAKLLDIPKNSISIVIGDKSRHKTILLTGEAELLYNKLLESLKDN